MESEEISKVVLFIGAKEKFTARVDSSSRLPFGESISVIENEWNKICDSGQENWVE